MPTFCAVTITTDSSGVNWGEASRIFELAPLGIREPDRLRRCFEKSSILRFAWDGDRLVGMARAISDGEYQAAIYDLCMLPEYQGSGIGRRLMESILAACAGLTVVLFVVPGKEGFYAKFGFETMLTGMARFGDVDRMRRQGYLAAKE